MGEAKRRKDLGLPPREKEFVLPELNKDTVKHKVRRTLFKYASINYLFYCVVILFLFLAYLMKLNILNKDCLLFFLFILKTYLIENKLKLSLNQLFLDINISIYYE